MPKADLTPQHINNLRNGFMQKAQVDRTVQNNLSDRLNTTLTADTAELSGNNRQTKKEVSSGNGTTSRPASSTTVKPETTAAGAKPGAEGAEVQGTLFPELDLGTPGANLLGATPTAPAGTALGPTPDPNAVVVADPAAAAAAAAAASANSSTASSATGASSVDPNSASTSQTGQAPVQGQASQAEAMQRQQMIENDAMQARTIYAQMVADRQKAFYKMLEILNQSRVDMFATLQGIMVSKCKAVETSNANFTKYLQM